MGRRSEHRRPPFYSKKTKGNGLRFEAAATTALSNPSCDIQDVYLDFTAQHESY